MTVQLYIVGGAVRNELINERFGSHLPTKDVDVAFEATGGYAEMKQWLLDHGFRIHTETEKFLTIRCGVPPEHPLYAKAKDLDAVLCRQDGQYLDGRRPEDVTPGTIFEDLARRDSTMNAIARTWPEGEILDPHQGMIAIENMLVDTVGEPMERWMEDGLRILRHVRQSVELGFLLAPRLIEAMHKPWCHDLLAGQHKERRQVELNRMFKNNSRLSLFLLAMLGAGFVEAALSDGIWLEPTYRD